jgi:hypothetical protein
VRLGLVLVVAACARSERDRPPDCERAITAASLRIVTESRRVGLAPDVERARLTMIASCEDERWTADVMHCIESARLEIDLATCTERLTHEQYERLQRKLAAVRGADAGVPAIVIDAALAAAPPADATVADSPPVDAPIEIDAAPMRHTQPIPPDAPQPDCTQRVVDPRNRACVRQFCDRHPDDLRCDVLE